MPAPWACCSTRSSPSDCSRRAATNYKNTPESARFFVQGSKDNHRNGLLHTANIWHRWSTLTDAVRTWYPHRSHRSRRYPRMDAQLHCRHATQRQRSRSTCGEGPGHSRRSPHPRSRRRLRRLLHRVRKSLSRCAVRDPRRPRGRAAHRRICQQGRRLGASQPSPWRHAAGRFWLRLSTSSC